MLDKIKGIFENLNDRFTNPFLFSFALSWIIYNWPITVSLLWSDSYGIEKSGYDTIYCFIKSYLTKNNTIKVPIIFAFSYTLVMPFIKALIEAIQSLAIKAADWMNFKIVKGSVVPIEKFLKLREEYTEKNIALQDIIDSESNFKNEAIKYKNKFDAVTAELSESENKMAQLNFGISSLRNIAIMQGYWDFFSNAKSSNIQKIYIDGKGNVYSLKANGDHNIEPYSTIRNFFYDSINNHIFFVRQIEGDHRPDKGKQFLTELMVFDNQTLKGTESEQAVNYIWSKKNVENPKFSKR